MFWYFQVSHPQSFLCYLIPIILLTGIYNAPKFFELQVSKLMIILYRNISFSGSGDSRPLPPPGPALPPQPRQLLPPPAPGQPGQEDQLLPKTTSDTENPSGSHSSPSGSKLCEGEVMSNSGKQLYLSLSDQY